MKQRRKLTSDQNSLLAVVRANPGLDAGQLLFFVGRSGMDAGGLTWTKRQMSARLSRLSSRGLVRLERGTWSAKNLGQDDTDEIMRGFADGLHAVGGPSRV